MYAIHFQDMKNESNVLFTKIRYVVITIFLVACLSASAQINMATLRGSVKDASGAGVPGAAVSVVEIGTNVLARRVTTDSDGNYEIPDLSRAPTASRRRR